MTRDQLDRYYTPAWPTEALLRRYMFPASGGTVLEPCAGTGGIANVLRDVSRGPHVITGDIDPDVDVDHHWDFTQARFRPDDFRAQLGHRPVHQIITNPPYKEAEAIARAALALCPRVALLLRLTWLEPVQSRLDLLQRLHTVIILPRISYTGDGNTDSTGGAWFIWDERDQRGPWRTRMTVVPQSERPPRAERKHVAHGEQEQKPLQTSLLEGGAS